MRWNMKKTKEEMVYGDFFCFLKVVSSYVCLLQGYVALGSDGVKLRGFNVSRALNDKLFFCVWWNFGNGGNSSRRMASEFNEGVAMKRIKNGHFSKVKHIVF